MPLASLQDMTGARRRSAPFNLNHLKAKGGFIRGGGWLTLFIALVSPLDALSSELFVAHMVQHKTMMLMAAPLLVASKVFPAWLWGLPAGWRKGIETLARSQPLATLRAFCTRPLAAWLIHAQILGLWHIPFLFQAAAGCWAPYTFSRLPCTPAFSAA